MRHPVQQLLARLLEAERDTSDPDPGDIGDGADDVRDLMRFESDYDAPAARGN